MVVFYKFWGYLYKEILNFNFNKMDTARKYATQFEFSPGQRYVNKIAQDLGIEFELLYHSQATNSCREKLGLLQELFPQSGWKLGRVVKTIFASIDDTVAGFVLPGNVLSLDQSEVRKAYEQAGLQHAGYLISVENGVIPAGMESGTCTPFVDELAMQGVDYLFIQIDHSLDGKQVDISLGGVGEEAHRTSMLIDSYGIYEILNKKFPGKVFLYYPNIEKKMSNKMEDKLMEIGVNDFEILAWNVSWRQELVRGEKETRAKLNFYGTQIMYDGEKLWLANPRGERLGKGKTQSNLTQARPFTLGLSNKLCFNDHKINPGHIEKRFIPLSYNTLCSKFEEEKV
jgi:hypothetical protein